MIDLKGASVLVTGADGFLGRQVVKRLVLAEKANVACAYHRDYDLTRATHADHVVDANRPDFVVHLAGYNGGIQFNLDRPYDIFAQNTLMGLNLINACVGKKVRKVLCAVASCAYPANEWLGYGEGHCQEPREVCVETDFFDGPPHETVACHGYAKRNLQLACSYAKRQYGLNAVCVCPATLYGPGDNYDPHRTKVVGAMVRRFVEARREGLGEVTCWGTGRPKREVLYVEDAARLVVESLKAYEDSDYPLNLGTGQEHTVKSLAGRAAAAAGYRGKIRWDSDRPDGQFRKRLNLAKMHDWLGPQTFTTLTDGLEKTVEDYTRRFACANQKVA
jgi:GDP-L-fucose synthase